jgi:hypothetical protein
VTAVKKSGLWQISDSLTYVVMTPHKFPACVYQGCKNRQLGDVGGDAPGFVVNYDDTPGSVYQLVVL